MVRVAVALSGGGCKGAFSAGVIKGMLRKVDEFVCAYGSSTGALIATCIAGKKFDFMTRVYTKTNTGNIIKPVAWEDIPVINDMFESLDFSMEAMLGYAFITKKKSLYSISPLVRLIKKNINFSEIRNSTTEFGYLVSNVAKNKSVLVSSKSPDISSEGLLKALQASVSIPIFMPPVRIPGMKGLYVDGGLTKHLPGTELLMSRRYEEADVVLFISTIPVTPDNKKLPKTIGEIVIHTLLGLSDSCDINSLQLEVNRAQAQAEKDGKKFILVRPKTELDFESSLDFDPKKMNVAFNQGIRQASEQINCLI